MMKAVLFNNAMVLPKARILAGIASLLLISCKPALTAPPVDIKKSPDIQIGYKLITEGLKNPVAVTHAGDDSGRQSGALYQITSGVTKH